MLVLGVHGCSSGRGTLSLRWLSSSPSNCVVASSASPVVVDVAAAAVDVDAAEELLSSSLFLSPLISSRGICNLIHLFFKK